MVQDVKLPEISENVESGTVIEVLVSEGDSVNEEQALIELETEKAAVEVPSPFSGKVTDLQVSEGDEIEIGQLILRIETDTEDAKAKETEPEKKERKKEEGKAGKKEEEKKPEPGTEIPPAAAPSVRRLAREMNVDLRQVKGTAPGGRISAEDVKRYAERGKERAPGVEEAPLPDLSQWGEVEREKMTGIRKVTARNVSRSWRTIPHVTQYEKADITELEEFRKSYKKQVETAGGKLTLTAILLKTAAAALKQFPRCNASIDAQNNEIVFRRYVHIGVAVDTEHGLLVPVIRDVDKKTLTQVAVELTEMAEKTRDRKVSPDEMQGGTFTVSNLGGIGGTNFTPIIYPPQVTILGVSSAELRPVYMDGDGSLEPRLMLPLALSYDHRVVDGADGIRFLRWFADALENPFLLTTV
jgi:pyruvate dehydrogenase E2 component (dihydrolipoamide acetyltransferase)